MAEDVEALLAEADRASVIGCKAKPEDAQQLIVRLGEALRATRARRSMVGECDKCGNDLMNEVPLADLEWAERDRDRFAEGVERLQIVADDLEARAERAERALSVAEDATIRECERADCAEAERDAARAALREVAKLLQYGTDHGYDDDGCQSTPLAIVRRALGEEP